MACTLNSITAKFPALLPSKSIKLFNCMNFCFIHKSHLVLAEKLIYAQSTICEGLNAIKYFTDEH